MSQTSNAAGPSPSEQLRGILARMAEMDYYQILNAEPTATPEQLRDHFYARSKKYHPDRYAAVGDPEMRRLVTEVYKQISEAYNVLKDPKSRRAYDEGLRFNRAANLRFDRERLENKPKAEYDGGTGPGAKYFKLAKQALIARNTASARNNIKLALSLEPKNEHFLALKREIEARGT